MIYERFQHFLDVSLYTHGILKISRIDILYIKDDFLSNGHILATYIMTHMKKI